MKYLLALLFAISALPLFSQAVLDSTRRTYSFQGENWFEITVNYYSNPKRVNRDTLALCGPGTEFETCDSLQLASQVLSASANAWQEWSGYKAQSQRGLTIAKSVQRDAVGFFQSLLGSAGAFVKAQNDVYFQTAQGRYGINTPDMPMTDFELTQSPNGTCKFVMVQDTLITMTAVLTSNNTLRFREKLHAKGTMIVTGVNQLAGDQVSVNGTTLIEGVNFVAQTNVTVTAANLAAAIDAVPNISATSSGAVISIVYDKGGPGGNVAMTYTQGTGNGLTLSGNSLSGGSNQETTWDVGFEYLNQAQKPVFFDECRKTKLVKKT